MNISDHFQQPQQPQQKSSYKKSHRMQVRAFTERENAKRLAEELKKKGICLLLCNSPAVWRGFFVFIPNFDNIFINILAILI